MIFLKKIKGIKACGTAIATRNLVFQFQEKTEIGLAKNKFEVFEADTRKLNRFELLFIYATIKYKL